MKKIRRNVSLNQRLAGISLAVFIPMILVMTYLLASLTNATSAYAQITKSVSYANMYARDFKERMDYSMYLAVIGKRDMEELGDGETTVNGILTVNPYKYIDELEETCDKLSYMATVDSNRNQIKRLKNSLKSLKGCVKELETAIDSGGAYEDKMNYLNENIYMLTSLIQKEIQDYIYVETTNYTNVKAELDARNTRTFVICIWISVAAIVLALFLTMKAAKSVTKPIQKLGRMTQQVAEGDFTVQTKESNTDEIAVLTRSFNDMTQEIGGLVEDIKQQQKNLRIAETKLLQAQINPHFLFNALESIRMHSILKNENETADMVEKLAVMQRQYVEWGEDSVTIEQEVEFVKAYLALQKYRFGERLSYQIEIDEECRKRKVPKLTLVTFVENACVHGIESKASPGWIFVRVYEQNELICMEIEDTGNGMEEGKRQELLENMRNADIEMLKKKGRVGIVNACLRLKMVSENKVKIDLDGEEGVGTLITIWMPLEYM